MDLRIVSTEENDEATTRHMLLRQRPRAHMMRGLGSYS